MAPFLLKPVGCWLAGLYLSAAPLRGLGLLCLLHGFGLVYAALWGPLLFYLAASSTGRVQGAGRYWAIVSALLGGSTLVYCVGLRWALPSPGLALTVSQAAWVLEVAGLLYAALLGVGGLLGFRGLRDRIVAGLWAAVLPSVAAAVVYAVLLPLSPPAGCVLPWPSLAARALMVMYGLSGADVAARAVQVVLAFRWVNRGPGPLSPPGVPGVGSGLRGSPGALGVPWRNGCEHCC